MKGELSLASRPPEGAGWREIAWAGFLSGSEGNVGTAGRRPRRCGRGLGEGMGRRRLGRKMPVCDQPLAKVRNKRGRRAAEAARSRRRRASMEVPAEGHD